MTAATGHPMPCPRCGATVAAEQDWCLECGAAARTRIVTTPRWRRPVTGLAVLAALSLGLLGFAFADLTADHGRIADQPTTVTVAPPGATTAPGQPAITTTPAVPVPTTPATSLPQTSAPQTVPSVPATSSTLPAPTTPTAPATP